MRSASLSIESMRTGRAFALGLCAAFASASASVAQWPCHYEVEVLKGPMCANGDDGITPQCMNESGQPAGSWGCGFGEGFPWVGVGEPGGTVLGLPPGAFAAGARAINDNITNMSPSGTPFGQVAGVAFMPNDRTFFYSNNTHTILPMIPNATASFAEGMNDAGKVVGYTGNFVTADPPISACYWTDGTIAVITSGRAFDANDVGQITGVVGSLTTGTGFVWHDGVLDILPPITSGTSSQGIAINDLGHVAGVGGLIPPGETNTVLRSFFWRDGEMTVLGILPGFNSMRAHDINDEDDIVGQLQHPISGSQNRAFLWRNGVLVDLNDLTPPTPALRRAIAITNDGVILAVTSTTGAKLTPVYGPFGDVNCDGVVDVFDLLKLLAHWGPVGETDLDAARCDLNEDGIVSVFDLLLLLSNWGAAKE